MERKEFLKSIGAGAAFALTFSCLGGCLREELDPLAQTNPDGSTPVTPDPNAEMPTTTTPGTPTPTTPSTNVLLTVDLTTAGAAKLKSNGGYIIKNNIVVAKNLNGEYVAATLICSHDLLKQIVFKNDEYYCTAHAARFDQSGKGLNSKGKKGLKIYGTSVNGSILSIIA